MPKTNARWDAYLLLLGIVFVLRSPMGIYRSEALTARYISEREKQNKWSGIMKGVLGGNHWQKESSHCIAGESG